MPIPQSRPTRRGVRWFIVFGLLLSTQLSFGYRWRSSISPSNPQVDFGSLAIGKTSTFREVLTNVGHYSITLASSSLSASGLSVSAPSFPLTLDPGESVTLGVNFYPQSRMKYAGTLVVAWGRAGRINIPVTGTGIGGGSGTVSAAPASLSFGNVAVGSSLTKSGTLTANGEASVINSITTTNAEFSVSGLSLPLTLAAGKNVSFTVKFTPQNSGTASASLSFITAGTGGPASQSLTGAGTAVSSPEPQHSVSLSWQDNAAGVAGYNVYRGTTSGGPYTKVNPSLEAASVFTDSTVQSGKTYFYVVSSVNSAAVESGYSAPAKATVPSP